jgi:hypothetical protein
MNMSESVPPIQPVNPSAESTRGWEVMCHLSSLVGLLGVPFGNILAPLVVWLLKRHESLGVDAHGTRLGTGAGFYDRCLHHLRAGRRWRRPRLIGVAYDFQRVAALAAGAWDVPLDALLTEKDFHSFKGSP